MKEMFGSRSRKALNTSLILPQPFGGVKVRRVSPLSPAMAVSSHTWASPTAYIHWPGSGSGGNKRRITTPIVQHITRSIILSTSHLYNQSNMSNLHRPHPASQRRSPGCNVPQKVQTAYTLSFPNGTRHGPSHFTWSKGAQRT